MLLFYLWFLLNFSPPFVNFVYKIICRNNANFEKRGVYQAFLVLKKPVPPGTNLSELVKHSKSSDFELSDKFSYICAVIGMLGVLTSCIIAPFLAIIYWYVAELRAKYEYTYRLRVIGLYPFENMIDSNGEIIFNASTAMSFNSYCLIDFLETTITVCAVYSKYF